MTDGTPKILNEMRSIIQEGKKLDVDTRDRILIMAVIEIYERLEIIKENWEGLKPMILFYKAGIYFAGAIGLSLITFIGMLITGQVELVFK